MTRTIRCSEISAEEVIARRFCFQKWLTAVDGAEILEFENKESMHVYCKVFLYHVSERLFKNFCRETFEINKEVS